MALDFQAQRVKMVDGQLRTTDVTGHALLAAFLDVPREIFVPHSLADLAYLDADLQVAPGRFLPEPSPFAKLVALAEVGAASHVLEIGCGTGYGSAILSKLAASVVALECDAELASRASANLKTLGIGNARVVSGRLEAGHAEAGPYDVIIFSGSVEKVPLLLFAQLKDGGRLVAAEGTPALGAARLYIKTGDRQASRFAFNASLKPLPGFAPAAEFSL